MLFVPINQNLESGIGFSINFDSSAGSMSTLKQATWKYHHTTWSSNVILFFYNGFHRHTFPFLLSLGNSGHMVKSTRIITGFAIHLTVHLNGLNHIAQFFDHINPGV